MSLLEHTDVRTDAVVRLENVSKQYGSGAHALGADPAICPGGVASNGTQPKPSK